MIDARRETKGEDEKSISRARSRRGERASIQRKTWVAERGTREATIRVKSLNLLAGRRSWLRAKRRAKRKMNAPQFSSSSSDGNLIFALFTIPTAMVSSLPRICFHETGRAITERVNRVFSQTV